MQKRDDQVNWIKDIPNWIRNAIGFITLIISFVLLFKSNLDLSILISSIVLLISLLLLSVYVIFSKDESKLVEGVFIHRFPIARNWAVVMIIPIITSIILILANRTTHDAISSIFVGNNKALDCRDTLLKYPSESTDIQGDDNSQILSLIDTESASVLYGGVEQVMSIFTDDSLIVDANRGKQWKGCQDIFGRYYDLLGNVSFTSLQHTPIEIKINGNLATVETVSESVYDTHYPYDSPHHYHQKAINRWTFIKYRSVWKLRTFVFGLPLK